MSAPSEPGDPPAFAHLSAIEWMALQVEGLFVHDARGRLLRSNSSEAGDGTDPPDLMPPRFFLGRTPLGALWRFAADVPEERVRELARLAAGEREDRALEDAPERMDAFVRALERDAPVTRVFHGPAFRFPEPAALAAPEGETLLVEADRRSVLEPHFPALARALEVRAPVVAACGPGGAALAVCYCATRPGPTAEAGVDTAPGFRRRGLATRVTARWAREVRARGIAPLYSTAWSHRASLGVALRLGLIRFGVDLHFR